MDTDSLEMHLLDECIPAPVRSQNIHKRLLDCLESKNFEAFKYLVEKSLRNKSSSIDINYVHQDPSEGTFLDIACKKGLPNFVKFLLEKGAQVNRINKAHNRAPIHFAVENKHADVLEFLLRDSSIKPNLQVGQQTALHMAVKKKDETCAKLLLEHHASPNIPNSQGLTALHWAVDRDQEKMVNLIFEKSKYTLDLDAYKDYTGQTAREILLKKKFNVPLPPIQTRQANVNDLKYYLIANDETNFLQCLGNLQNDEVKDSMEQLMNIAVQQNLRNAVSALLERVEEGKITCDLKDAAQLAIQQGSPDFLRQILDIDFDRDESELFLDACIELGIPGKGGSENMSDRLECVKLILDRDNVDVRYTDAKGNTPLHYAARADCREAVTLLLEKGSYIGYPNKFGVPPIADISASTLSRFFDDCIHTEKDSLQKYTIEFDYKSLMPYDSEDCTHQNREMDVFQFIADNSSLKHLLKHPLLSSFLYLKWHSIRHILYLNFAFYVVAYMLLNAYILIAMSQDMKTSEYEATSVKILRIITFVAMNLLAGREIFQLISSPWHYVSSLVNWLEMALVFLWYAIFLGAGAQVAAVTILLSAWEMVVLIGQHPRMSTGIEMFKTVSLNFMRFLFLYAFLILAFALAFYTLFKNSNNDNFPDVGHSLFKTIIMLTGEFDANDIPFVTYPILSHFVFVLFVFLIAIVLFNLLNGLAVSDTVDILNKAELVGLISRIKLIAYIEKLAVRAPFVHGQYCLLHVDPPCCWRYQPFAFLTQRILLFPNLLKGGKLRIPEENNEEFPTLIMDPHIIKQTKQILSERGRESDTEKIITEMRKVKDRLSSIEHTLNALKRYIENNNFNAKRDNEN